MKSVTQESLVFGDNEQQCSKSPSPLGSFQRATEAVWHGLDTSIIALDNCMVGSDVMGVV